MINAIISQVEPGVSEFKASIPSADLTFHPVFIISPAQWLIKGLGNRPLSAELDWYLNQFCDYPFEPNLDRAEKIRTALKQWGKSTFELLFKDIPETGKIDWQTGGEIKLRGLDSEFQTWPWEVLYSAATGYLAEKVSIYRDTQTNHGCSSDDFEKLPKDTIEVLLITARANLDDIAFRSVSGPLLDTLSQSGLPVNITLLRPPTEQNLANYLASNPGKYHIVHFDCHGGVARLPDSPFEPAPFLLLETESGAPAPVSAASLANLFSKVSIPYAVLNACRSAAVAGEPNGANSSIATALLSTGCKSVVAMSHNLRALGAARFFPKFYESLGQSGDFHQAVKSGRSAMYQDQSRSSLNLDAKLADWILPMVFSAESEQQTSFPFQLHSVPVRDRTDEYFAGRDQLFLQLERALFQAKPVLLIFGMGGIGKTCFIDHFIDWIKTTNGPEVIYLKGDVTNFTQTSQKLIVWDDFAASESSRKDLTAFFKDLSAGDTKIILASRKSESWITDELCTRFPMSGLRGHEMIDLITNVTGKLDLKIDPQSPEADQLFIRLDGHPVLIQAVLQELKRSGREIADLFRNLDTELDQLVTKSEHKDLFATMNIIEEDMDSNELKYLIPLTLHEFFIRPCDVKQMVEVSGEIEGFDWEDFEAVIKKLISSGLLCDVTDGLYTIHPLLTSYLRRNGPNLTVIGGNNLAMKWVNVHLEFMGSVADQLTGLSHHDKKPLFLIHNYNFIRARQWALEMQKDDTAIP